MSNFWILLLLLLATAFLFRIDFIYYVVYVVAGVYLWSRWRTPHALKGVTAVRSLADHAFLGETIPVTITVHNRRWLPVTWLQLVESVPPELRIEPPLRQAFSLGAGKSTQFDYRIRASQRGYYRLGPLRFSNGDLFGLTGEQSGLVAADYLTVYPRLTPLTALGLTSRLPFGAIASHQRLFEDPARPMGVRDYQPGDTLRRINWKVSAHSRTLLVKTFQPAISLETTLLLNLHGEDYARRERRLQTEWAIEVAASLAAHLTDRRQAVGLTTNGIDPLRGQAENLQFDETSGRLLLAAPDGQTLPAGRISLSLPPQTGRLHLMKILEQLARVEFGNTSPFSEWAPLACNHLSWGVTILAITSRGDEATCSALHRLLRAGFNPILVAVAPDHQFGVVRQRARRLGFQAFNVAGPRDLEPWRRPRRAGTL